MAVVSKDELLNQIKNVIGDNTSDEALALIENASDTLDEQAKSGNNEELTKEIEKLKKEKDELDKTWRDKYRERFFSGSSNPPKGTEGGEDDGDDEEDDEEPKTFDDLFTQEDN